jgi:Zn ribbon nucleic-acid-binding protein
MLPPDPRRSIMIIIRPLCPACQARTTLARITPGPLGFDIQTFECPACDHVHQTVVELIDPMKSVRTNAWLRGQLLAPT